MNQTYSGTAASSPKAGSSADLRVVSNDGPVAAGIASIAEEQNNTMEYIERLEHLLKKALAPFPEAKPSDAGRPPMETELNEALYLRLEHQRGINARLSELLDRIRL